MKQDPRVLTLASRESNDAKLALFASLLLAVGLIATTWGGLGSFSSDAARWFHEVDRAASGERPYVDFYWAYAPASIWILGAVGAVFGSSLHTIWITTSIVFIAIVVLNFVLLRELLGNLLSIPVALAGILLASGYGNTRPPIPVGTYTPAGPIGFLFLLAAIVVLLRLLRSPSVRAGLGLGLMCGLSFITKHDYWVASLYVLGLGVLALVAAPNPANRRVAATVVASFLGLVAFASFAIVRDGGWSTLSGVVNGFGQVAAFAGRGWPTWERLTVEVAAFGIMVAAVTFCLLVFGGLPRRTGLRGTATASAIALLAAIVHMTASLSIGMALPAQVPPLDVGIGTSARFLTSYNYSMGGLMRGSVYWFAEEYRLRIFPLIGLLAAALWVLMRWQQWRSEQLRNTVLALIGLCLSLRARRQFEFVEWHQFFIEIPTWILFVKLQVEPLKEAALRQAIRLAALVCCIIGSVAVLKSEFVGRGLDSVHTPNGTVRLSPARASLYRDMQVILDRIDPQHRRPLFAIGSAAGMNYFFGRRNPTPLTQGFRHWSGPHGPVVNHLMTIRPGPILIDHPFHEFIGRPQPASLGNWDLAVRREHFLAVDRPLFEEVAAMCNVAGRISKPVITIFDCTKDGSN